MGVITGLGTGIVSSRQLNTRDGGGIGGMRITVSGLQEIHRQT